MFAAAVLTSTCRNVRMPFGGTVRAAAADASGTLSPSSSDMPTR